jgi:hypothetical protein
MIVDRLNKVHSRTKPSSVKIGRESMKCLGISSTHGIGIDPDRVICTTLFGLCLISYKAKNPDL